LNFDEFTNHRKASQRGFATFLLNSNNACSASTTGLGAISSQATDSGNFHLLLAATVVMAIMVVTINRLVWRPLYGLASTRFKLEG
jgi:NitT/TauT family transport system permease protein